MDQGQIKLKVQAWLNDKFEADKGYFLVDLKLSGAKLQVFVEGDQGISIDKCAEISRYLEGFLDEEKILGDKYILEVSSPGMDNPLKTLRQYENRIGRSVSVLKTDGQRVDGILKEADQDKIMVELPVKKKDNGILQKVEIPFSEIKSTKLNFNF